MELKKSSELSMDDAEPTLSVLWDAVLCAAITVEGCLETWRGSDIAYPWPRV